MKKRRAPGGNPSALETGTTRMTIIPPTTDRVKPRRSRGAFPDRNLRRLQALGARALEAFVAFDGIPLGRWSR